MAWYPSVRAAVTTALPALCPTQATDLALLVAAILAQRTLCRIDLARAYPTRSESGRYAGGTKGPRIPSEHCPEVAARAQRERLRSVARDLGVSHETVRSVVCAMKDSEAAAKRAPESR